MPVGFRRFALATVKATTVTKPSILPQQLDMPVLRETFQKTGVWSEFKDKRTPSVYSRHFKLGSKIAKTKDI